MDHKVLLSICLMADILKLLDNLSLALQKQGALLVDIKRIIQITLEKLQKLTGVATSNHFQEVLFPTNSFYASYQKYLDILQDFQNGRRNLRYQGHQMANETFHLVIAIPVITNLIVETEEAFDAKDFSVIGVFHAFDLRNIPTIVPLKYGLNEAKIIYSNYGNNKVNIYQEQK